ncbi:8858_t:CDS:2 [Paraglomus brasilianum]|uniref:8858_t:CDS:1 n=1 Tax=Paraglomus brasilianum TaxID=144538 RepID=A0A9N9DEN1_9GLOM|nr:8858_t:CDS:2 [Paraglomus brasilianum]
MSDVGEQADGSKILQGKSFAREFLQTKYLQDRHTSSSIDPSQASTTPGAAPAAATEAVLVHSVSITMPDTTVTVERYMSCWKSRFPGYKHWGTEY